MNYPPCGKERKESVVTADMVSIWQKKASVNDHDPMARTGCYTAVNSTHGKTRFDLRANVFRLHVSSSP
jgi:hypothetical protein